MPSPEFARGLAAAAGGPSAGQGARVRRGARTVQFFNVRWKQVAVHPDVGSGSFETHDIAVHRAARPIGFWRVETFVRRFPGRSVLGGGSRIGERSENLSRAAECAAAVHDDKVIQ